MRSPWLAVWHTIALSLTVVSCAGVPRTPSPPLTRCWSVTVRDAAGVGVVGAEVRVNAHVGITDASARVRLCGIGVDTHRGDLAVEATGYRVYSVAIDLDAGRSGPPFGDVDWPDVQLERSRRFPAERGRIHVCGVDFCDETGGTWDWRGASMFTLPARFVAGEDITPQIRWMQETGVNVARVFVNWDLRQWNTQWPFDQPDYDDKLGAFFDRLATEGLRVEATILTENGRAIGYWRPIVQRVFTLAATRWNVMIETANEPWERDVDPLEVMRGVDRHGVLSAYGTQPEGNPGTEEYLPLPVLDYVTPHLPREGHFPHNSKDTLGIRSAARVPVVDDEPMGIGPPRARGGRTRDADAVWSHFAICRLFAAGCTIHTQAGIDGLVPTDEDATIVAGIGELWSFLPGRTYTGGYVRAGLGDFALRYRDGDSLVNHAYGSLHGSHQWVVVPMPRPGWSAEAVNGWRIDAFGPVPYVLRLTR